MPTSKAWSKFEVEVIVEDYFDMLRMELTRRNYNKSAHRRAIMDGLNSRTQGSIELKHQNISAVLIEMGVPYIDGYKPRFNYQKSLLPTVVSEHLSQNPGLHQLFQKDSELVPNVPTIKDLLSVLEKPPQPKQESKEKISEVVAIYNPSGVNYLEREAENQSLGDAGESFVINYEKARLIYLGKENLADRVEQVSTTVGPSAGFDILSFESDGSDRFIEAKTTKYGKNTPFFVTPNELRFSENNQSKYFLYRVFKYRTEPRLFTLNGFLTNSCDLKPSQFLASLK